MSHNEYHPSLVANMFEIEMTNNPLTNLTAFQFRAKYLYTVHTILHSTQVCNSKVSVQSAPMLKRLLVNNSII